MAWGQRDGTVTVFDTWTGTKLLERNTDQGMISSLAFSRDQQRLASAGADTTVLIWKVPKAPALPCVPGMTEAKVWDELGAADAKSAFRAASHLIALGDAAVPLLARRLTLAPELPADPERINRLVKDLGSDTFNTRERATQELSALGAAAEAALKRARESPSLECRLRAERLFQQVQRDRFARLTRLLRVVEVLEHVGSPAARQALREWCKAKPDPILADAIRQALVRLGEAG